MQLPPHASKEKDIFAKRGVGIGLYICKHVVDAHEGKIWMESGEGVGTDIPITLPI